jgi:hypothetical protein
VGKDEKERRRVFAVHDVERAHSTNPCAIHRGDCSIANERAERALLCTGEQVITPQLEVLARGGLSEGLAMRKWRDSGNSGSGEKFTSVHEYLV